MVAIPSSSSTTSTSGPEPDAAGSGAVVAAVMAPRLGQAADCARALLRWTVGRGPRHSDGVMQAEAPVEQPRGVSERRARLSRRAVQYHPDQDPLVVSGLEQQAFAGRRRPAGLDPDRAGVAAKQQVRVLPEVTAVLRTGEQQAPPACDPVADDQLLPRRLAGPQHGPPP